MINVDATLDGEAVTIVQITADGSHYLVTYIDASNNLKVKRKAFASVSAQEATVATGASIP